MVPSAFDPTVLRELADDGNQDALDRLAELADASGDVEQLNPDPPSGDLVGV
jgi:hypothetical protein